jgi:hypothetical protein
MPLEKGSSREVVGHNIKTEQEHGKPRKQAVAIALSEAGLSNKNKDEDFGETEGMASPDLSEGTEMGSMSEPMDDARDEEVDTGLVSVGESNFGENKHRQALDSLPASISLKTIREKGDSLWQQKAAVRPPEEGGPPPMAVQQVKTYQYPSQDKMPDDCAMGDEAEVHEPDEHTARSPDKMTESRHALDGGPVPVYKYR